MAASDAELKLTATLDDKATAELQKLADQTRKLGEAGKKAFDGLEQSAGETNKQFAAVTAAGQKAAKQVEDLGKKGKEAGEGLGKGFKEAALQIVSIGVIVGTLKQKLLEFATTFQSVDVTLARIQAATGATDETVARLEEGIATLGLTYKNFVREEEVAVAAQILLNEKFATTEDVIFKVADALAFSRVQGITLTEAIKLLTDASGAFAKESTNSVDILSKLRFVQKETASDLKVLATGFDKIGNTAQATGVTLEDLLASFTVLRNAGTSEGESLRFLEGILKSLQVSAGTIEERFASVGQTFSAQSVQTAGLSNTLKTLFTAIEKEGGNANEELKKIFGSQDVLNAAFAIGVSKSDAYKSALAGLTGSAQAYNKDLAILDKAQGSFTRVFSEGLDAVDNARFSYKLVTGDLREFGQAYETYAREQARAGITATQSLIDTQKQAGNVALKFKEIAEPLTEFGPFLVDTAEKVAEVSKVAAAGVPDVKRWFDAVSGAEVDEDLERINREIERLTKQALAFSAANIEGFDTEGLKKRLEELSVYEQLLLDQLAAKRKADTDKATADKEEAILKAKEAEARSIEDLSLQRAQADKEEFDRRIRQAQELNALSAQLLNESLTRGSAFFADLQNQIKPLAAEIQLYEGLIANNLLSDEDLAGINGRIQTLRAGIEQLTVTSVQSGEALRSGFAETINNEVKDSLNAFKQGVTLAQSITSGFTNSIAGLFNDLVLGSKSAKEAFGNFIKSLISAVVQAINQIIAMKIALSIIGFVTGAASTAGAVDVSSAAANASASSAGVFAAKGGVVAGSMGRPAGLPVNAYAQGGVARSPQVAVFGEGKGAEAFVPLPGPNRGIPVEFKSMPSGGNIVVNFSPNISALDGASVRDLLVREGKVIGDIVASEIATGSNRGLTDIVRGRA
jgi:hypothetical protein